MAGASLDAEGQFQQPNVARGQPRGAHTATAPSLRSHDGSPLPAPTGVVMESRYPRREDNLPRPLTAEDDIALKNELRRHNDPLSNALLLTRLTGMRPGETVDLALDCLH